MASTSLVDQLQKLSKPQSSIYKDDTKRTSLLFDPKEAASKDRDTFYEIGLSGFKELQSLYDGFSQFQDTLFSVSSKAFERALYSEQVNRTLDLNLKKFFLELSPYLLLQSSQKALEWLVNRYSIHEYNQKDVMALILPYHETKIFIRFIQIMDLSSTSNEWHWLEPLQKPGIPLAKQVLYNHCASQPATLTFIAKSTFKYANRFGERASLLNTYYAFFCSTAIGTLNTCKEPTEMMTSGLFSTIMIAMKLNIDDFRCSAYVVLGYLLTKAKLKNDTLCQVVERLLSNENGLTYDIVLLINILYTHQTHLEIIPESIYANISVQMMASWCDYLKVLVSAKVSIERFVQIFLTGVLALIQKDNEEFRRFKPLPELLIEEVDFKNQNPEKLIRCIFNSFNIQDSTQLEDDDDGSDIELVSEEEDFSNKITNWYSTFMQNIERKYPAAFDKVVKEELLEEKDKPKKKKKLLLKILGFIPSISHRVNGSYLFTQINNVNSEFRVEAMHYIVKKFETLKTQNVDFVKDSIISRLNDDNPDVVLATLNITTDQLQEIITEKELTEALVNIVNKPSKKFNPVVKKCIEKFCSLDIMPVNHQTVLALLPYLFPKNEDSAQIAWQIISSPWGEKFELTKDMKQIIKSKKNDCNFICENMFKILFQKKNISFQDIIDINMLNKNSSTEVISFILLKSCSFESLDLEEIAQLVNLLLETAETREIIILEQAFSAQTLPVLMSSAKKNLIVFEIMEYVFMKIIKDVKITDITKPWCNFFTSPGTILVRKLFEIFLVGCSIENYSKHYSILLQKLLEKFCNNKQEKFEFIVNFACGHFMYAESATDVISPEFQLRSLKLLLKFIQENPQEKWLNDSEPLILMILFNLNNPILLMRQCAMEIVEIVKSVLNKNNIFSHLLNELLNHKEELLLDPEQIPIILNTILSQNTPATKIFRRNFLLKFMGILMCDIPSHIISELLKILSHVNHANAFSHVVPALTTLEIKLEDKSCDILFNIYESKIFRNIYSRINSTTVSAFASDNIWNSMVIGLKEYRQCILLEDQTYTSPSLLIMKQINEEVFKEIPNSRIEETVYLLSCAAAFGKYPIISSTANKVIKKIHLEFAQFKHVLDGMLNVQDPVKNLSEKKKKSTVTMLSHQLCETNEWRIGVAFLESIQNKKKMTVDNSFVSILIQLLNRCLRFEEQHCVEYTKQLLMSSLSYYCKKFVTENDQEQVQSLKSIFDIEVIVRCIRGTQNPQTHHHSLILLSHAAFLLPEQALHHTMEIFTFMGTSVLRHDDAYSFQIITKIIETLIPILVKLNKPVKDLTGKEFQQLQKRVVPVLRIFADAVLHVPEHRRLPLYEKLISTLGASQFFWIFLALLLETHIKNFNDSKEHVERNTKKNLGRESSLNRLDFGQNLLLEFPPEICLENFHQLMVYLKSLPLQKDENAMETDVDPSDIFSVNGHSAVQLRHYKYVIITFMNTCLASPRFIQHTSAASDINAMENNYKSLIVSILTFIQDISKAKDENTAKYWRVMLHHSYELLDHTNSLLSAPIFISVVKGLLNHNLITVRRKTMELLNTKIQYSPEMFADVSKESLFTIIPGLLDIVKTIDSCDDSSSQEMELNQQTALLSLKLLTRMLAADNPEIFKPVLETVTEYTCKQDIGGNVMASVVLCLAELCGNLKAHSLVSLRKFMPALIKILKNQRSAETPELILLSTVTAISKIVESVPLFLSPYLQKILYEYAIYLAKWQKYDQDCSKVSAIVNKLMNIKKKIASSVPSRVLIPVTSVTHRSLIEKEKFDAVGPVMAVLAESFGNVTAADFKALQQDLTSFALSALQLRSDAVNKNIHLDIIDSAEDEVVNALVCLVLKLSETSFRPFYFKIFDWAIRTNVEKQNDRAITFYKFSSIVAEKLKGLFVLFAGHFVKNAAELLDACNLSKTEDLYFDSEEKCTELIKHIIKTLHIVFLYDSQSFVNKDRFDTFMQPIVDQLENTLGGISKLQRRAKELVIPCISQLAVAIADDSLWKLLNYQILLKTRHNDVEIRLLGLDCLVAMATALGSSWLPLLAESAPFLAELLEDGDQTAETAAKSAINTLEQILGEPLQKYF